MAFLKLKSYFAGLSIKQHLKDNYDQVKIGAVTYSPKKNNADGSITSATYSTQFTGVSKETHEAVKGSIGYAPSWPAFFSSSGPANPPANK